MLLTPISVSRKNDAVVSVCQDNENNIVQIKGINSAAEVLLGYHHTELTDQALSAILPSHLIETLNSYIEFEADGNDVAAVLGKMRNFSVVSRDGALMPIALKVFSIISNDPDHPCFELLMRDNSRKLLQEDIAEILSHIEDNGMVDLDATTKILSLIINYKKEHEMDVSFSIMKVDNFHVMEGQYDLSTKNQLFSTIGKRFADCCRDEDVITYLGNGQMGVMLFDCSEENSKIVLNRLRMAMGTSPLRVNDKPIPITVSISFTPIWADHSPSTVIQICQSILQHHQDSTGDKVYGVS